MELKHTPGPWQILHSQSKDAFNIVGSYLGCKYKIARVPYMVVKPPDGTDADWSKINEANKREAMRDATLIASAPDMLAQLAAFRTEVKQYRDALEIAGEAEVSTLIQDESEMIEWAYKVVKAARAVLDKYATGKTES
jgi:hypothetical protein